MRFAAQRECCEIFLVTWIYAINIIIYLSQWQYQIDIALNVRRVIEQS